MSKRDFNSSARIGLFIIIVFSLTGLIIYRLFDLTYVQHSKFVETAKSQYNNPSALLSGRGNIYFSDLSSGGKKIAATNRSSYYLYSNNAKVAASAVSQVAPIVGKEPAYFESLFSQKDKNYLVIARNLTKEQTDRIKSLKLEGLSVALEINRYYVQNSMAAPVLGFVGFEGNQRTGRYGIESYYNGVLNGEMRTKNLSGNKTYSDLVKILKFWEGDKAQNTESENSEKQDGSDLILTIDQNIQSMAEIQLASIMKRWRSPAGSVIIEDPATGAILAMASSPSFDPNNYSEYEFGSFLNPNTQAIFEPGSSFKLIAMAAALNSGAVTPETTYNDTGAVEIGGYTIRNFNEKANGTQTMRQVLEHSLNTGAIFAEEKTGDDSFLNYVVSFGFGQKTGVDASGEAGGDIANLYSGRKINFLTASFGQGIAVTPLQLINAYSAIANGGRLMKPYLIRQIVHPDGTTVDTKPKVLGAPISEKTSAQLKSMLVDVVNRGFDKAKIKGYDIAGKTGTAQIPDPQGGYLQNDQFIHDFVGFAPAYSPKFVILIKMERPQGIKFAADSLSPVFGDMARYLIRYFNIPPTR